MALSFLVGVASISRCAAGGAVGYSDFGRYLIDTHDTPGVQVILQFHGYNSVLQPGWYQTDPTVSNVTFHGHMVMQPGGVPFLVNYDNGVFPLTFHCITGFRAFGGYLSSYSSPWQSNFTGTITTDQGDIFTFQGRAEPNVTFFGLVAADSVYDVVYDDGGAPGTLWLHEEAVYELYLVMNPPPTLAVSIGKPGEFNVAVNGAKGQTVVLESSINLVAWQPLATNVLTSDRWVYPDARAAPNASRYFRTSLR